MVRDVQVAAFEGGQLRILASHNGGREAVLALPLSRLIVKMLRVPKEAEVSATALSALKAMSPYPDEELLVSCELVRETAEDRIVIAAAFPEGSADDIGEALDAAKLNVTRIDALVLGFLRSAWEELALGSEATEKVRRLFMHQSADCISAIVLDGGEPVAIRAISLGADVRREAMLCLLEAEDFGGERPLAEVVSVGLDAEIVSSLSPFAPVRSVAAASADAALEGVAERTEDPAALNALPQSWHDMLQETRFKAKMTWQISIAAGIWCLVMAVLFGGPIAYRFLTDHQRALSKEHQQQYRAVKEMKEKTELVRKYSDHARGALEIMKALSDRLPPEGMTLSSWSYKRGEGVRVSGEADGAGEIYDFKDRMAAVGLETDEDTGEELGEAVFKDVVLSGPSATKNGQRFELNCRYEVEGEP